MSGMMMSPTSELTMAPKAAPMMTPTARSTTLPRMANFLNSSSIDPSLADRRRAFVSANAAQEPVCGGASGSVDQAGMDHGFADGDLRLLGRRHHRQAQPVLALAQERQGIFDRRRARLDEEIDVERRELVLQLQRRRVISSQARRLEFGAQSRCHVRRHRDAAVAAMGHE